MRNILYIVPSDFVSLEKKGVVDMILQRDEGGFFDNVLTLHPFTKENKQIELKKNNEIIEYGWKSKFEFLNKFLVTKIFGTIIILFKLIFIFPFVIKKEKISIIRATDPYYMGLIGLYYSKIFNIPLVISIHSDYDMGDKLGGQTFKVLGSRKIAKRVEKFVYNYCSLILPISSYLKEKIIKEFNIKDKKIKIFYHGISFQKFDQIEKKDIKNIFNINNNVYLVGYIARLSKEKNCLDILDIAIKLKEKKLKVCILVVGDGKEFNYMKKIINKSQLKTHIKLLGFQNKKIVYNIRKEVDINLCLLDGFSLIEACASSKPIIAYDIEWHNELVQNNRTGFLIDKGNIEEVVEKIEFLIKHPQKAKLLGKNARELAYKNHDIKNVTKIKQNIYRELI